MTNLIDVPPGLNDVAVAETRIGTVHGDEGFFHYRQHDATELASRATFEDVWHLLDAGHLPDAPDAAAFTAEVAAHRPVPSQLSDVVTAVAATGATPLARLRTVLSVASRPLGLSPLHDIAEDERRRQARRLVAVVPSIVAALHAADGGRPATVRSGGHVSAYLEAVLGRRPPAEHVRALEQYLILTVDHGFNASTFTARVAASTGADLADVVCAAIGSLAGPLHGGAPSRALDALDAIGRPERAADWVRAEVAAGRRIMGFGHAVYRAPDPRSQLLRQVAEELGGPLVERAVAIEAEILATLAALKPDRPLPSNVEFYAGVIMESVGLPRSLFTPTFAVSRCVGWAYHALEQAAVGKLIRPAARYIGPEPVRSGRAVVG